MGLGATRSVRMSFAEEFWIARYGYLPSAAGRSWTRSKRPNTVPPHSSSSSNTVPSPTLEGRVFHSYSLILSMSVLVWCPRWHPYHKRDSQFQNPRLCPRNVLFYCSWGQVHHACHCFLQPPWYYQALCTFCENILVTNNVWRGLIRFEPEFHS